MLRRILALVVVVSACGDDGGNRHLADAPPTPDMEIVFDMPIDEPITPPKDLELGITASGNGSGRITSAPAGIDCGTTCMADFEDGTMVTLTAEPDASSVFTGWGGACSGTSPVCEVTITAATSVTATFTLKTYTVTVTKAGAGDGTVMGNGINCGSGAGCMTTVNHGAAISLTAAPVSLNTFVGWGGACSGTGTCDLTITADTAISAAFALDDLSLIVTAGGNGDGTITSNPAGINCPGTCDFVFTANEVVTLTPTPAESSTFTGWSGECTGMGACVVTMDAAKAVTGNFTLKTYALDVNKTGSTGTGTITSSPAGIACGGDCTETYDHGEVITLTATATLGTSSFTGWSGGGCSGTAPCDVTLTAATTVTAVFAINSYQLTTSVTGNGTITGSGIDCPGDCMQSFTHGTPVPLTANPGNGYTFVGWGGACSGTGACDVTMDMARSVSATFMINSYDLDVSITGTGSVTATPQISCPSDCTGTYTHDTVVSLTQMAGPGYTFTGWSGACTGTGACNVTMDAIKNVTATFTINSYALNVSFPAANTGTGTITATNISCPGDCTEMFTHDTVVSVTQTPNSDSNFTGWGGACSGTGACNVTMDMMKSVTASYTLKTYNLDVSIVGTGSVSGTQIACPNDCTGTFSHGAVVALTPTDGTGYHFTGWSGACTGVGACNVTMDMAKNVTATFTINSYVLSVGFPAANTGTGTITATNIACPTDCMDTFTHDTVVTVMQTPNSDSNFTGWGGACSGLTTCNVTMNMIQSVTASYALKTYDLTASITSGTGTISATNISCPTDCVGTFTHNSMVPVTHIAGPGYEFTGWGGACTGTGTCSVTMDMAKSVSATFTQLFTLNVTIAGSTGTVMGTDISCPTDCTDDYLSGASVTLTAAGTGGATFSSWSGAPGCTTATMCTVMMSQTRNVTATFTPPSFLLTVQHGGNGFGTIQSSAAAPGIDCSNNSGAPNVDCTESYLQNTMVTLTATGTTNTTASEASFFSGWSGACSGTGQCTVTMDAAKTAIASFTLHPNVMFVTSRTMTTDELGTNWENAATAFCKNSASASTKQVNGVGAHQNTSWVPWISGVTFVPGTGNVTINARDKLAGFAGWERVDAMPMLVKLSDLASNAVVYPPMIDENGQPAGPGGSAGVWTGTNSAGNHSGSSCVAVGQPISWTGTSNASGTQGLATANSLQMTDVAGVSIINPVCTGGRRLYCFGADRLASLPITRAPGRFAFTSESTYMPGNQVFDPTIPPAGAFVSGAPAMDVICRSEASAASLPNAISYRALVATTTSTAIGRFSNGLPWVRVGDQQQFATHAQLSATNPIAVRIEVAPNAMASGTRVGNFEIWTGAADTTKVGNLSGTCGNWNDAAATKSTAGYAFDTGMTPIWFGGNINSLPCNSPRHFVCMENGI